MHPVKKAFIGFVVGWSVCNVEYMLTGTAWGGIFTILMVPFVAAIFILKCVAAAALLGLILRVPAVEAIWAGEGYFVLLLALPSLLVLVFSSPLGFRTIEPVSGYSMMSPWPSRLCYFFLVFPFVNLPAKRPVNSSPPPSDHSI
jgi:hypothetical protein